MGALCVNSWDASESHRSITNTLITNNTGVGICSQVSDDAIARWGIMNTTITQNRDEGSANSDGIHTFETGNGNLTAYIYNSILWGNERDDLWIIGPVTFEVDHSDIRDVSVIGGANYQPGVGAVDVDLLFVSPYSDDFHLQAASPLIDTGINQGTPFTDLDGNSRDLSPDIGVYEGMLLQYTQSFSLAQGLNMIPLPLKLVTPFDARGFTDLIEVGAPIVPLVTLVIKYDTNLGKFGMRIE